MSNVREQLGELSIERRTLLLRRLRERQGGHPAIAAIPLRPGPRERFPLAFGQLRLWLLQQLTPASTADHLLDAIELPPPAAAADLAPLAALLGRALADLTARHEVLRTRFLRLDHGPVQDIAPVAAAPAPTVPFVDLRGLPREAREGESEHAARTLAGRSFALDARAPWRQAALLTGESLAWTFCFHHLIYDGWSAGVFQRELLELIAARAAGRAARLPALPVQYGDFAVWQRGQLTGERLDGLLAYWRERLAGLPERLDLPADRPRGAGRGRRGERRVWRCPADTALAAARLARQSEVSHFVLLLAVFQLLLGRLADTGDVAVATAVAGRDRPETQGLLGFFVNTLVLRTDLTAGQSGDGDSRHRGGGPTLAVLLPQVRDVCHGAFVHQDLPFDRLVEDLRPHRESGSNPLAGVLFSHEAADAPPALAVRAEPGAEPVDEARFELLVTLVEAPGSLQGVVEYRTGLFDAATIERLLRCYETLLAAAARAPATPIADLPWLTAAESRQALLAGNGTAADIPRDRTLPELFAEQAALRPDAAAHRDGEAGEETVTYGELQRRAAGLASRLATVGVTPGSRVGILLPPGRPMVIAMLAVLQAGAAYVPLETDAPAGRLESILADAAPAALVRGAAGPPLATDLPVLAVEEAEPKGPPLPRPIAPRGCAVPESPACVLFTSGSTGRPKGVVIPHRAIVRLTCANRFLDFAPGERFANGSNPAFDASTLEIWTPLLAGGTVVGLPKEVLLAADRLPCWLAREQITAAFFTTSLFHHLIDQNPQVFAGPWVILFGGEAADPTRLDRALAAGPAARLINIYGPTEVTTVSTTFDVRAPGPVVPIGAPIGNTLAYVLDERGAPVPEGVPGELYLGGEGLAQGYLGQPGLTAERFVPDPFTGPGGGRLYRTGDRVRRRVDGRLVFLGRRDHQVKLRGFRIELAEIEAVLAAQPEVGDAIVVVAGEGGGRRLVAYVSPAPGGAVDPDRLAESLGRLLPAYMIPAAWMVLDALPVNANGKLDRGALPDPAAAERAAPAAGRIAAPEPLRDATEKALAGLFAEVLHIPAPGLYDDFFHLGGHSLLAIDLIGRARRQGFALDLRDLFEEPTVAGLARRCREDSAIAVTAESADTGEPPGLVTGPCALTPRQRLFLRQPFAPPCNTLLQVVPDGLEPHAVQGALAAVLRHHDGLRSQFTENRGVWTAHLAGEPAELPLCWLDLAGLAEGDIDAVVETLPDVCGLFDLARGPLLVLLALSAGPGRPGAVLWVVHHLVDDGFSLRLIGEDFLAAYRQLRRGDPLLLPPKTTSLAVWTERLRAWEATGAPRSELSHWLTPERLAAAPLPVDDPAAPDTYRSARRLVQRFPTSLLGDLLSPAAHRLEARPEELILAALQAALTDWTGGQALLADFELHGRATPFPDVDLSRTVGWLSLAVPLLLRPSADPLAGLRRLQAELRVLPAGGHGWSLLTAANEPAIVPLLARRALAINLFLGKDGGLGGQPPGGEPGLTELVDLPGELVAPTDLDRPRQYPLTVHVLASGGRLELEWGYSASRHRPVTLRRLAESFDRGLLRLLTSTLRKALP